MQAVMNEDVYFEILGTTMRDLEIGSYLKPYTYMNPYILFIL